MTVWASMRLGGTDMLREELNLRHLVLHTADVRALAIVFAGPFVNGPGTRICVPGPKGDSTAMLELFFHSASNALPVRLR